MFEGEEYRSYIQLCRELRLPRMYWQQGDLQWHPKANPDAWPNQVIVISDRESAEAASMAGNRDVVWLPRLDQWLTMLEEVGEDGVTLVHAAAWGYSAQIVKLAPIWCASFEESCALLWMAVTGRTVTT